MKITIIGIGAMASLMAAQLHESAAVTMVGHWPAQLAYLQRDGLHIQHPNGRLTHHPVRATNNPADAAPADVAIVLVKSWQTADAAALAQAVLSPHGIALTLQNGLGNLEQLTAVLGPSRATLGTTSAGAHVIRPGFIALGGQGVTHIATTHSSIEAMTALAALLNQNGFETHLSQQVEGLVWGKLAINAGINPLTALLQVPNGFLAENEAARALMQAAATEAAQVAKAQHITLPYTNVSQQVLNVARATAQNRSSMLQDVLRGAPTEIEAICGAVVANGRLANISTPINKKLLKLVQSVGRSPMTIAELQQIIKSE